MIIALFLCSCSHGQGSIEIKEKSVSGNIRAGDGIAVYSYEVDYPKIKLPGNKEVSKAINANIENEIAKITEPAFDYAGQYDDWISRGVPYVSGASYSESFEKTYCDDEFISFEITLYCHEACAMRDTEETRGLTLSLKTGDTVSVYDIAADGAYFREVMFAQAEKQLLDFGKEKDTEDISLEDAFTIIDRQSFEWYMAEKYVYILFAPGEAAPIMLGTLRVEIPLGELTAQPSNGSTASVSGVSS